MKRNKFTRFCARWALLMVLSFPSWLHAQCDCTSNNQNDPDTLYVEFDCMKLIDGQLVLDDLLPPNCDGPYTFEARDNANNHIATGTPSLMIDLAPFIGEQISIKVSDNSSNEMCTGFYIVADTIPPMMVCEADTITCVEYPNQIKEVTAIDECGTVTFLDTIEMKTGFTAPCTMNPYYGSILRIIRAQDEFGNISSCSQNVVVLMSDFGDVQIPADTVLDCSSGFDTSITGVPTIHGQVPADPSLCNLQIATQDLDTLELCGAGSAPKLVLRQWAVTNDCTGLVQLDTQLIRLIDTVPPTISCLDSFTFELNNQCLVDIFVDTASVTDNCSLFKMQAFIGATEGIFTGDGFIFTNLTKGEYTLQYVATDSCGLSSTCESEVIIEDNITPVGICEADLVVSLDNNGMGMLFADDFDEGSNDNCTPTNLLGFQISRNGVDFDDFVTFNCDDVFLDSVLVTLLVIDLTNIGSTNICMAGVTVVDKIEPVLICPLPMTIDCEEDYSDLSLFGQPFIMEACDTTVTKDSTITIDNCGTGTITRMWTVTDPSDNVSFCTQEITVENQTPYNGAGIVWPSDYIDTIGCTLPGALEPPDLPPGFEAPFIPAQPCAMIATSYSDQLFYIDFPACYKIVRTWKVLDWCQYDPSNPTVGIWQNQQVIAVMDFDPPVIDFCPSNDTFGLDNTCTIGDVLLQPVLAHGTCPAEDITITNDSPFANANGANASGEYPEGTHTINFTIEDGCGNKVFCSVEVVVTDNKKPTPMCKDGIVGELQFMANASPQIMAVVGAEQLNYFSFDNCTDEADLVYTMRLLGDTDPPVDEIVFDCDGEGIHDVEIWVTDQSGNADFCITEIIIQDNMDLCSDDSLSVNNAVIGGGIQTQMGEMFPDVHVDITSLGMSYMTDNEGVYEFQNLNVGGSYSVEPWKNDNPKNGVTTFDIVLIMRHVLSIQLLDSPYKLIAADINSSGTITTHDIVELRKLILGIYNNFPDNSSWRFVEASYVFPNPATPSNPPYPEVLNIANLNVDLLNADFIGVKIGDVNGSAAVDFGGNLTDDREAKNINILLENRRIEAGESFTVPVRLEEEHNLLALQFTLEFETDLELQGIEKGALSSVAGDRFETTLLQEGVVTGSWYHTAPVLATKDDALFSLRFKSKNAGRLSDLLSLTSNFTEAVAYDEQEIPMNLNLVFINPTDMQTNLVFQLHQNQPNPFKRVTNIGFTLPETGPAKLVIYDVSGNILKTYNEIYEQGYNEISIMRQELPAGGVLFYKLQTPTHTATKKMILLK